MRSERMRPSSQNDTYSRRTRLHPRHNAVDSFIDSSVGAAQVRPRAPISGPRGRGGYSFDDYGGSDGEGSRSEYRSRFASGLEVSTDPPWRGRPVAQSPSHRSPSSRLSPIALRSQLQEDSSSDVHFVNLRSDALDDILQSHARTSPRRQKSRRAGKMRVLPRKHRSPVRPSPRQPQQGSSTADGAPMAFEPSALSRQLALGSSSAPDPGELPVLPKGKQLVIHLLSNWGDPWWIGLQALEVFDDTGRRIDSREMRIWADPAGVNDLPGYDNDLRVAQNLLDEHRFTTSDFHSWMCPFRPEQRHLVALEFHRPTRLSCVRIWNYNRSRIHSYRGARLVELLVDGQVVFRGEVKRAPGSLNLGMDACFEMILFSTDSSVLRRIEDYDAQLKGWEQAMDEGSDLLSSRSAVQLPSASALSDTVESFRQMERPRTAGRRGGRSHAGLEASAASPSGTCRPPTGNRWSQASAGVSRSARLSASLEEAARRAARQIGLARHRDGSTQPPRRRDLGSDRSGLAGDVAAAAAMVPEATPSVPHVEGKVLRLWLGETWGGPRGGIALVSVIVMDSFLRPYTTLGESTRLLVSDKVASEAEEAPAGASSSSVSLARPMRMQRGTESDTSRLFDGYDTSSDPAHMWRVDTHGAPPFSICIEIAFDEVVPIAGVQVCNANSSVEDSFEGVRRLRPELDGKWLGPCGGYFMRKAPGNASFDCSQRVLFAADRSDSAAASTQPPAAAPDGAELERDVGGIVTSVLQQYMPPIHPSGCIVRFRLLTTHGDPHYIGLNGIGLYGPHGEHLAVHSSQVQAFPRDVNVLRTVPEEAEEGEAEEGAGAQVTATSVMEEDPRTPEKLFDGVNDTLIDSHMWLAPYSPGFANQVFVVFEEPITIALVKIWNYAKTPSRGVNEFEILLDDVILFRGVLKEANVEVDETTDFFQEGEEAKEAATLRLDLAQSFLFTDERKIVESERHRVYLPEEDENVRLGLLRH